MTQQALRDALEAMAALPGVDGCALVEVDAGMVWHHAGQIEGVQTFAEAASDYWRLYGRLAGQFEDLGELRTLAVDPDEVGQGVGRLLVEALLDRARELGVSRVFCLTFEVEFFRRHGFAVMADQSAVDPQVYAELLRSTDEGVAEFLDLARVKPNTLGNTRMILKF